MAKVYKNQKSVVLSKNNLLIQPLALTLLGINPTVIGNRVCIAIVRKLQDAFKWIINERKTGKEWNQLSIFDTDEVRNKFLGDNKLVFDVCIDELVDSPENYSVALQAACQFADVKVIAPVVSSDGTISLTRTNLFSLILREGYGIEIKKDKDGNEIRDKLGNYVYHYTYNKRTKPVIGFAIERVVAEYIFSFQKMYSDYLDYTAIDSNEKYFPPLYIYLSAYKYVNGGVLEVEYRELRRILGLEYKDNEKWRYPVFTDFNKRVLTPCMNILREKADRGESDCYFDFEKIYLSGKRAPNPDKIKFNIYLSELGKSIKEEKVNTKSMMDIESRLVKEFDQTKRQVRSIMKGVSLMNRVELHRKMDRLAEERASGKIKIESSWRAYCNVAFTSLIEELSKKNTASLGTLPFEGYADAEVVESLVGKEHPMQPTEVAEACTDEELVLWNRFIDRLKSMVSEETARVWVSNVKYGGREQNNVLILVPTRTFWEMFAEKCSGAHVQAFTDIYGESLKMKVKVVR